MRLAPGLRSYDRRKQEARLDDLWRRIIKARAGFRCEVQTCGSKNSPQAAHIFTKSRKATRWNPSNGICLCAGHHMTFHRNPLDFLEWVDSYRGAGTVDRIRALSMGKRADLEMVEVMLRAAAREWGVKA